jgi:hypothetical protein
MDQGLDEDQSNIMSIIVPGTSHSVKALTGRGICNISEEQTNDRMIRSCICNTQVSISEKQAMSVSVKPQSLSLGVKGSSVVQLDGANASQGEVISSYVFRQRSDSVLVGSRFDRADNICLERLFLTVNSIDPIGGDGAIGRITKVWW